MRVPLARKAESRKPSSIMLQPSFQVPEVAGLWIDLEKPNSGDFGYDGTTEVANRTAEKILKIAMERWSDPRLSTS